ncbi:unnamed protein product [Rhizopus stolonifer]
MANVNKDKLLLIFVHGFRGSDTSFKEFPNRLQTILTNSTSANVEVDVYPSYKTAGELKIAVDNFSSWLYKKVSTLKLEMDRLNDNSNIMIVLLGHSMGGIVAAETLLGFKNQDVLGAKIIGMLAYDTPFYSINHSLVADQAKSGMETFGKVGQFLGASALVGTTSRAIEEPQKKKSSWGLWAGVGAVAVGAAAAYLARDKISETLSDAFDELTFVKDLSDMHGCDERVRKLLQLPIFFKSFYILLPGEEYQGPRTFIKLPPEETRHLFIPIMSSAPDVLKAHTSMFDPKKTQGYYQLGSDSLTLICDMIARFQRKH